MCPEETGQLFHLVHICLIHSQKTIHRGHNFRNLWQDLFCQSFAFLVVFKRTIDVDADSFFRKKRYQFFRCDIPPRDFLAGCSIADFLRNRAAHLVFAECLPVLCQFKEKLLGRRGDFDDDYPSLPCPWSPPQVKAWLLGYCTGQPSVKLRPPVLESGEQGLSSKLSLPTESCLPCGLSVLLHLQWQPMGVFLVSSHHPRTPVKTLAFQLHHQSFQGVFRADFPYDD